MNLTGQLLIILVCLIIATVLKKLFWHFFKNSKLKKIPGPWGLPFVGCFPFLGRRINVTLTKFWRKYGDVYQIKVGNRKIVVLNGHDAIRKAMVQKSFDFSGRPDFYTYEVASRDSLIGISDYSDHYRIAKKLLLKAFGAFVSEKKSELQSCAHKAVEQLIEHVKKANNQPFDPNPVMSPIVCTIMGYVCWGSFFDVDDDRVKHILGNSSEFGSAMAFGVACDYFPCMKGFFKKKLKKLETLMYASKQYSSKLASKHVESYDGESMRDITDFFHKEANQMNQDKKDLLDLSQKDLLHLPGAMFGAGFNTIVITTKWAILLLAKHPEFQSIMQQELDRVVGPDRYPSFEDSEALPYSMAVIHEVYRYSSIAHMAFAHKTMCDTEINGFNISKGTTVIANFYSAHRDPRYFNEPYKFNPERFLDNGALDKTIVEKVTPYGLGMRRCGGETVAKLEIFTFITTLVQRCRIEETAEFPLNLDNYKATLGLNPNPFKVVMKSRYNEW